MVRETYTPNEIRILHLLKNRGGSISASAGKTGKYASISLYKMISDETGIRESSVRNALQQLDQKCAVIRHYSSGKPPAFGSGGARLIKVELVDPKMILPPMPKPPPLAVIMAQENEELYERTAHEPDPIAMLEAVVEENSKLHEQLDKLHGIIEELVKEQERAKRTPPTHLTQKVKSIVPQEVWDRLSH